MADSTSSQRRPIRSRSTRGSSATTPERETAPKAKRTRVRTGCLQCKRRRVRCDEQGNPGLRGERSAGQCTGCRRLGLECSWPSTTNTALRRTVISDQSRCITCQLCNLECSGDQPHCKQCVETTRQCVYGQVVVDGQLPLGRTSTSSPPPTHAATSRQASQPALQHEAAANSQPLSPCTRTSPLPSLDNTMDYLGTAQISLDLIAAFFSEVYPCTPFGFLRQDNVTRAFEDGRAHIGLVLAMCSLSAKYVIDGHADMARVWLAQAKEKTFSDIARGRTTASTLSSLLLCFYEELYQRDFRKAWVTSGSAIRIALALRLNYPLSAQAAQAQRLSWADNEARRRLMWAIHIADKDVSDGYSEYSSVPLSAMRIDLPCDEKAFRSGEGYDAGQFVLADVEGPGPWVPPIITPRTAANPIAQYIIVYSIRTMVLTYARHRGEDTVLPWQENSAFEKCMQALQWWEQNIPPELQLENRHLPLPTSQAELTLILALHLWLCVSYCDLGRLTIYTFVESVAPELLSVPQWYVGYAQEQCVEHASKIVDLCELVLSKCPTFISRDPHIAACLYQAVRITLWDVFRHPSPSLAVRRFTVDRCRPVLVFLQRMKKMFPYVGSVLNDVFSLFDRYGITEMFATRANSEIVHELQEYRDMTMRTTTGRPHVSVEPSLAGSARASPEPEVQESTLSPDQSQTMLFRPPFRVNWRTNADNLTGGISVSNVRQATATTPSSTSSLWQAPQAGGTSMSPSAQPAFHDVVSGQPGTHPLEVSLQVAEQQPTQAGGLHPAPPLTFSITPGLLDAEVPSDTSVWAALFGEFAPTTSLDSMGWVTDLGGGTADMNT